MIMRVLLAVLGYLVIGGILATILDDDELTASLVIAWPLVIVLFTILFVYGLTVRMAKFIAKSLSLYFSKEGE